MTKYPILTMNRISILSNIGLRQPIEFLTCVFPETGINSCSYICPPTRRRIANPAVENRKRDHGNWHNIKVLTTPWLVVIVISCLVSGCQSAGPITKITQTDRLMATYPDLKSGKFALIADFESPTHMELVQLLGVSQNARSVRSTTAGRTETGGACLSFTSGSAHDTLMLSNNFAAKWYLRRDWRPFDLLLMAVQAPQDNLTLDLTILAGAKNNQLATGMKEHLRAGWNMLRIDLAELGERIPLDDIRELKLAISGADGPVQINIDDIILTSSRDYLLGNAEGNAGKLYVQRRGRRWHIGAGERFELVFANGQIVAWYNTETDPYKLKNLVHNTVLGPMPILLNQQGEPSDIQPEQRHSISAHQRIVEISPVRIVLQARWEFANNPGQSLPNHPNYVWTYTIYPTGQVFVDVLASPPIAEPSGTSMGLAVSLASENADTWLEPQAQNGQASSEPKTFAFARSAQANAAILFAPSTRNTAPSSTGSIHVRYDQAKKIRRWIYSTIPSTSSQTHFQCQIFVASSTKHKNDELRLRANQSDTPHSIILEVGTLALAADQKIHTDSWQNNGTIDVAPGSGSIRMIIDNADRQLFTPCIRVHDRSNRKAWVYIDHLIYKNFARESDGNLVFQLPKLARRKTVVEVLFQQ